MNFFEHQDRARKRTGWLVFFFLLAVLCLIVLTNLLVVIVMAVINGFTLSGSRLENDIIILNFFSLNTLVTISLTILSIVLLATLYKMAQLSRGGKVVAEAMGGQLIIPNTDNPDERKILNVVEEMAIASGVPVPAVYLLEEEGINAFAAGNIPADAVIGITRGCIELLDRHELQGVVAHEFSHILHGDMKLNTRLIGVLHGILIIGIIGYYLLRSVSRSGYRSRSGKNNGTLPFLALGAGLMVIGYAGTFFGNLIKAGVSRQREFLADASAVQFTRNPEGIGGALKKIGGASLGSRIEHPNASEVSHLFFGQAIKPFLGSIFATHPPLAERIRRIDPQWNGQFPRVSKMVVAGLSNTGVERENGARFSGYSKTQKERASSLIENIGEVDIAHLAYAQDLLQSLPVEIKSAAREPYGARALIYCLLIDSRQEIEEQQWRQLQEAADPLVYQYAKQINCIQIKQPDIRLPLIDLCLPTLKQLSEGQYQVFKSNLAMLMKADNQVELFEWALYRIVLHYMEPKADQLMISGSVGSFKPVAKATALVLSALASAGAKSDTEALASFESGKKIVGLARLRFVRAADYQLRDLSRAISILNQLKP
ncbi:MAG: M48 family metallopeptidase, partial [Pseudomonadales bacterium]|nr:M48 family metallopeptidase [Pseudomonadales bacterium]